LSKDRSKEILREISLLRRDIENRLEAIEDRLGVDPPDPSPKPGPSVSTSTFASTPQPPAPVGDAGNTAVSGPVRDVTVTVRPLTDVGLARAVENSLSETDGIESARLTSLTGDSAIIHAVVGSGVSVVRTLRQTLPVAFDVIESSDHAVSIELALREQVVEEHLDGPEHPEAFR
jgi:hypothetical protein